MSFLPSERPPTAADWIPSDSHHMRFSATNSEFSLETSAEERWESLLRNGSVMRSPGAARVMTWNEMLMTTSNSYNYTLKMLEGLLEAFEMMQHLYLA